MAETIDLEPDAPPTTGEWVDHEQWFGHLTDDELDLGHQLGQQIDPDDDNDNGAPLLGVSLMAAIDLSASARRKAAGLKACLLDHGVPEVSIELLPGRPVTGNRWDALHVVTNFSHHTVSGYSPTRLTPCLGICTTGRSDVPGPLCNGFGGWDLTARLKTFGLANHPGAGGPTTVNGFRIPKDSARRYAWGWEFEGGLAGSDWDRMLRNPRGKGRPMTFREFMARCAAGTQDYFGLPADAHLEHSSWTERKIDRLGYTRARGITEIRRWGAAPSSQTPTKPPAGPAPKPPVPTTPEDDMPLTDVDKAWIRNTVASLLKAGLAADNDLSTQIADLSTPEADTKAVTTHIAWMPQRTAEEVAAVLKPQFDALAARLSHLEATTTKEN